MELGELAVTAATTLVKAMTTDGWERIKQAVANLWHRRRPEQVERVACDLDEARSELTNALERGDTETEAALVAEWQGRLRRLLAADRKAVGELQALLGLGQVVTEGNVRFGSVTHSGTGDVHQAGRDMTIHRSGTPDYD